MKLKNIATRKIRRELNRRERGAGRLRKQHANLAKRLAGIEAELADLGVDGAPVRRGRPPGRRGPGRPKGGKNKPGRVGRPKGSKNKKAGSAMTLREAIAKGVRVGSTVSPAQAAAAAKKAGYKSASPNFGMMVGNMLAQHPGFKHIERGKYQRTK